MAQNNCRVASSCLPLPTPFQGPKTLRICIPIACKFWRRIPGPAKQTVCNLLRGLRCERLKALEQRFGLRLGHLRPHPHLVCQIRQLRDPRRPRAHHGDDPPLQLGLRRPCQEPLDRRTVDLVAVFIGDGPAHAHERSSDVLLRDGRAQGVEIGFALEHNIDGPACGRRLQREARLIGVDFP